MGRLLDGCAALGLLHKRGTLYRERCRGGDLSLLAAAPHTLRGYVRYSDAALYGMWGHLEDAVREGTHRWTQTFGLEGPIFSAFFRTDEAMRDFLMGMHGFGMLTSPQVVARVRPGPLSTSGGSGRRHRPSGHRGLRALPGTARRGLRSAAGHGPGARAGGAIAGTRRGSKSWREISSRTNFPPPICIYLGRILHDWAEDKIERLLRRIFERLPAGGALLIGEKLLEEDGVGPSRANMQSLNMLIVTEGRERSLAEYAALLRRAGFGPKWKGAAPGAALDTRSWR